MLIIQYFQDTRLIFGGDFDTIPRGAPFPPPPRQVTATHFSHRRRQLQSAPVRSGPLQSTPVRLSTSTDLITTQMHDLHSCLWIWIGGEILEAQTHLPCHDFTLSASAVEFVVNIPNALQLLYTLRNRKFQRIRRGGGWTPIQAMTFPNQIIF
jgi:hypothetical protein